MPRSEKNWNAKLLIPGSLWEHTPNCGFLTPTCLKKELVQRKKTIFGAVRDKDGKAVIRRVDIDSDYNVTPMPEVCFDRRNSGAFDTDGTILGHVESFEQFIRLYYVGFRRSRRVKFEAYSGIAESVDYGKTFEYRRKFLDSRNFTFLNGLTPDIVACHWNNLNENGDGLALVAIGNGWIEIGSTAYPKYSSYLIAVDKFSFQELICQVPQKTDLYRLGRPRFIDHQEMRILVATGGKVDGDYRPYFFEYQGVNFHARPDLQFPLAPGEDPRFKKQVSYPELVAFPENNENIFLFNGDNMGGEGCYSINAECQ